MRRFLIRHVLIWVQCIASTEMQFSLYNFARDVHAALHPSPS
jgi:hypothetical protein